MRLRIHLADTGHQELLRRLLRLVLDPLVVLSGQLAEPFERLHVALLLVSVGVELQAVGPARLVQVQ